ncbi:MAG: hypothetical protein ACE5IR_00270 [bacterium]
MKELLYFSASDLMIQVDYKSNDNSIHYFSHRQLTFGERVVVEQYLLANVAIKTEYYKKHPAILNYLGINGKLIKDLNQFHLKNTIKSLKGKEKEAEAAVQDLINEALSKYYFEQIGNVLIDLKNEKQQNRTFLRDQLIELIDAYNLYSDRKVPYEEVLPKAFITNN